MHLDSYKLLARQDMLRFEFYSDGPKGLLKKEIEFTKLYAMDRITSAYSISLLDMDIFGNYVRDKVATSNGDGDKVFATVAKAIIQFSNMYPKALIHAQGSTAARTRLYRIQISKMIDLIGQEFEVIGVLESGVWETYEKDRPYSMFLAQRKAID